MSKLQRVAVALILVAVAFTTVIDIANLALQSDFLHGAAIGSVTISIPIAIATRKFAKPSVAVIFGLLIGLLQLMFAIRILPQP